MSTSFIKACRKHRGTLSAGFRIHSRRSSRPRSFAARPFLIFWHNRPRNGSEKPAVFRNGHFVRIPEPSPSEGWAHPARPQDPEMHKLVLIRHGESVWNQENRFTGWTDVDLSDRGRDEAREAGRLLKERGVRRSTSPTSRCSSGRSAPSGSCSKRWTGCGSRSPRLAAQRAALRRTSGAEQVGDRREVRRGAGQDLAASPTTSPAPARSVRPPVPRATTPATPGSPPTSCR